MLTPRICTQEDLDSFAPPSDKSSGKFEQIVSNPDRGFYCLDWDTPVANDEPLSIGGGWAYTDLSEIDFILAPCNYIHTELGDIGDTVSDDCIADLDKQKDYLGPLELYVLANVETF